jgi:hypothetical protein
MGRHRLGCLGHVDDGGILHFLQRLAGRFCNL